jgi:hypothetical protein
MTALPAPSNHPVFLLAEHLDMILAAVEDLNASKPPIIAADPQRPGAQSRISLADFVRELQRHELAAVVYVGRARELTRDLVRRDKRFAMLGGLFVGGTAALDEAVRRMADKAGNDFVSGGDPIGYLRSRGVIDEDVGAPGDAASLVIGDTFRLAGDIETGPLVELVSTFLNTIELHFDLFPELMEQEEPTLEIAGKLGELVN